MPVYICRISFVVELCGLWFHVCLSLLFKLQELPTPQLCHAEYVYRVKHIHASHFAEKTVVVVHVQQWYTDPEALKVNYAFGDVSAKTHYVNLLVLGQHWVLDCCLV